MSEWDELRIVEYFQNNASDWKKKYVYKNNFIRRVYFV